MAQYQVADYQVRPMPREDEEITRRTNWVSQKRNRNLSITDEGWKLLGDLARQVGNRSEAVEVLVRYVSQRGDDLSVKRQRLIKDEAARALEIKADVVIKETTSNPDACGVDNQNSLDTCGVDISACSFEPQQCSI